MSVIVASKLPFPVEHTVVDNHGEERTYVFNGTGSLSIVHDAGESREKRPLKSGVFALTPGIPDEVWKDFLDKMSRTKMVRNGLIYSTSTMSGAKAEARERKDLQTKLEPIDPEHPEKHGITNITKAEHPHIG